MQEGESLLLRLQKIDTECMCVYACRGISMWKHLGVHVRARGSHEQQQKHTCEHTTVPLCVHAHTFMQVQESV